MVDVKHEKHIPLSWDICQSDLWSFNDRYQPCYFIMLYLLLKFLGGRGNEWKIDKYFKDVVTYGHIQYLYMCIIVRFLLGTVFSYYRNLYVTLHPFSSIYATPCFMYPPPDWFCNNTYKFPWDISYNTPHFTGILNCIYIIALGRLQ